MGKGSKANFQMTDDFTFFFFHRPVNIMFTGRNFSIQELNRSQKVAGFISTPNRFQNFHINWPS